MRAGRVPSRGALALGVVLGCCVGARPCTRSCTGCACTCRVRWACAHRSATGSMSDLPLEACAGRVGDVNPLMLWMATDPSQSRRRHGPQQRPPTMEDLRRSLGGRLRLDGGGLGWAASDMHLGGGGHVVSPVHVPAKESVAPAREGAALVKQILCCNGGPRNLDSDVCGGATPRKTVCNGLATKMHGSSMPLACTPLWCVP